MGWCSKPGTASPVALLLPALALAFVAVIAPGFASISLSSPSIVSGPSHSITQGMATHSVAAANNSSGGVSCGQASPSGNYPQLVPSICVSPTTLCEPGANACGPGIPSTAQVHLWVNATGNSVVHPPYVQVVFVVETTLYDGVYDPSVRDSGLDPCGGPCFESDGVPFFVKNAGQIASDITMKNAGVTTSPAVTFAMVDYFSTQGQDHDDGDGSEYNVDVSNFQPAAQFGTTVGNLAASPALFGYNWNPGAWTYGDSDFSDNFLSSSMITAMYGALKGSGLGWSTNSSTYHVIVWIGSTLPRDPGFVGNYGVTYSDYGGGNSATCEPSYTYSSGLTSPNCETMAQLVALAQSEKVIIDTIDLPDGMTEAGSQDYNPPNSAGAVQDVKAILNAGCYLAEKTGGDWEGPTPSSSGVGYTCPAATTGTSAGNLTDTSRGSGWAWGNNPTLGWALTNIHFPSFASNVTAYGARQDTFQYIPPAGFALGPGGTIYNCIHNGTNIDVLCQNAPQFPVSNGVGWGWPYPTMYLRDQWSTIFNVSVTSSFPTTQLNTLVPIDVCTRAGCLGGNPYTEVRYTNYAFSGVNDSFLPAFVKVIAPSLITPPPPPPHRHRRLPHHLLQCRSSTRSVSRTL